jgi:hypothetical protein
MSIAKDCLPPAAAIHHLESRARCIRLRPLLAAPAHGRDQRPIQPQTPVPPAADRA